MTPFLALTYILYYVLNNNFQGIEPLWTPSNASDPVETDTTKKFSDY
jgi:hypothetical protein